MKKQLAKAESGLEETSFISEKFEESASRSILKVPELASSQWSRKFDKSEGRVGYQGVRSPLQVDISNVVSQDRSELLKKI